MSNVQLYYLALRTPFQQEERKKNNLELEGDEPSIFQSKNKDRIRDTPDIPLYLPSVPEESPEDILRNSGTDIPSYAQPPGPSDQYPTPPPQVYIIPITNPNYQQQNIYKTNEIPSYAMPPSSVYASAPMGVIPQYLQTQPQQSSTFFQNPPQNMYGLSPTGIPFNTAPNEPKGPQRYSNNRNKDSGEKLFADMFSRADKNDDGGLTFEEFREYFGDDILTDVELLTLFNQIDTNNNGNIELSELIAYFKNGYGPFQSLFESLSSIHKSISSALNSSYDVYTRQNPLEQFKTRVYLKESLRQISALETPIKDAMSTLELTSRRERYVNAPTSEISRFPVSELSNEGILGSSEIIELRRQVNRLAEITRKLGGPTGKLNFTEQELFEVTDIQESYYVVVSRSYQVLPEMKLHFRDATRCYVEKVRQEEGNLQIYVSHTSCESEFSIYEIWADQTFLSVHNRSACFRQYQKDSIDCLECPATVETIELPCSWWE